MINSCQETMSSSLLKSFWRFTNNVWDSRNALFTRLRWCSKLRIISSCLLCQPVIVSFQEHAEITLNPSLGFVFKLCPSDANICVRDCEKSIENDSSPGLGTAWRFFGVIINPPTLCIKISPRRLLTMQVLAVNLTLIIHIMRSNS